MISEDWKLKVLFRMRATVVQRRSSCRTHGFQSSSAWRQLWSQHRGRLLVQTWFEVVCGRSLATFLSSRHLLYCGISLETRARLHVWNPTWALGDSDRMHCWSSCVRGKGTKCPGSASKACYGQIQMNEKNLVRAMVPCNLCKNKTYMYKMKKLYVRPGASNIALQPVQIYIAHDPGYTWKCMMKKLYVRPAASNIALQPVQTYMVHDPWYTWKWHIWLS